MLQSSGKRYSLRGEGTTSLIDLRSGPSVIIGAFDIAWTLRLLKPPRFHFANNREMTAFGIVDADAGRRARWTVDRTQQIATNNYRDYAIVARFTDDTTGKPTLIVAGTAGATPLQRVSSSPIRTCCSVYASCRPRPNPVTLKHTEHAYHQWRAGHADH